MTGGKPKQRSALELLGAFCAFNFLSEQDYGTDDLDQLIFLAGEELAESPDLQDHVNGLNRSVGDRSVILGAFEEFET